LTIFTLTKAFNIFPLNHNKKAYLTLTLWKTKCIPHIKFFLWLMLVDRLNKRTMLLRINLHVTSAFCVITIYQRILIIYSLIVLLPLHVGGSWGFSGTCL
jgi:hypothetical protein